tara:strand:- start:331 stop:1275 length:945 start_codon:yes stop_codon:yes gene_type:complete
MALTTIPVELVTLDDGVTITVDDNSDALTLTSTDADASIGPVLNLYRNSSSPADSDLVGSVKYVARNDNSQDVTTFTIQNYITDVSDGTEDAASFFYLMEGGALRERLGFGSSATVFNEDSQDVDFRVESDDSSTMFKVDAGNNQVSVTKALHGPGAFIVSNNSTNGTDVEAIITSLTSDSNNTNCFHMKSTTQGIASYGLRGDGSSTFTSDERLKTNIVDVEDGLLEKLNSVRFVNFKWKADPKSPVQMGVIAQELEKIFPDLVVEDDDAVGTGETYKSVSYGKLNLIAIKAIQEQQALIETLEAKVKALEEA